MTHVYKIAFVISNLKPGGAEKNIAHLANICAQNGKETHLILLCSKAEKKYFELDKNVIVHHLDTLASPGRSITRQILSLRHTLKYIAPDLAVAFLMDINVRALLASIGLKHKNIVAERTHPKAYISSISASILRFFLYPFAAAVIVQTQCAAQLYPWIIRRRVRIIPNGFPLSKKPVACRRRHIIAAGSLLPVKGFDVLIRAFDKIAGGFPNWHLTIWGDGPLRPELESLIRSLNRTKQIALPGISKKAGDWVKSGEIFVLSSQFEGFPNVLGEAMAAGLTPIASDCACGPAELIENGENGLLVPPDNIDALAATLERVLANADLRQKLSRNAYKSMQRYEQSHVDQKWFGLFEEVIS